MGWCYHFMKVLTGTSHYSSRLQLDVRNLSLGRRHLVNAYDVK